VLAELLDDVDPSTAEAVAWRNCAKLYGLDPDALRAALHEAALAGAAESTDEDAAI
jgi:hypothetical protein